MPQKYNLTPKQEKFCHEYLKTGNASAAYRAAYDTSKMKPESVNRLAKAQLDNVKISSRIGQLQAPAIKKVELTVENHLVNLEEMRIAALEAGNFQAAIRAEELKGKVGGFYTDKIELDTKVRMVVFDD